MASGAKKRRDKEFYWANREKCLEWNRRYYEENKERSAERAARRRFRVRQQCPSWANRKAILEVYKEAQRLTEETGIPHNVDHIYPLQGELVSGLHYEKNLRILTESENKSKQHRIDLS